MTDDRNDGPLISFTVTQSRVENFPPPHTKRSTFTTNFPTNSTNPKRIHLPPEKTGPFTSIIHIDRIIRGITLEIIHISM